MRTQCRVHGGSRLGRKLITPRMYSIEDVNCCIWNTCAASMAKLQRLIETINHFRVLVHVLFVWQSADHQDLPFESGSAVAKTT
jgi:hypothetical protein